MALKATIFKANVDVSNIDENIYTEHNLTLAQHPSETDERMMTRLLAYVLNVPPNNDRGTLEFGKDMWEPDEPCLIQKDLTGLLVHWIEVGQPDDKRITRICNRSERVTVYSFSSSTDTWWAGIAGKLTRFKNLTVWQIPAEQSEQLAALTQRSMNLQLTVQDGHMYIGSGEESVEITLKRLHGEE